MQCRFHASSIVVYLVVSARAGESLDLRCWRARRSPCCQAQGCQDNPQCFHAQVQLRQVTTQANSVNLTKNLGTVATHTHVKMEWHVTEHTLSFLEVALLVGFFFLEISR
jgi:hypothetical protein